MPMRNANKASGKNSHNNPTNTGKNIKMRNTPNTINIIHHQPDILIKN